MKSVKLLVCGTFLTVALGVSGQQVNAAEYSEATKATSNGEITFEDGDPVIIDPTNPDQEITPEGEINVAKGDLVLQYVSDFNFGTHKKVINEFSTQALPDTVNALIDGEMTTYNVPLFVSTKDMRTERGNGWTLTVTADEFKSSVDQKVLKGGEVVLTNAVYKDLNGTPDINSKASSQAIETGLVLIPGQEVVVANADTEKNQGIGSYSLSLGELVEDNGVTKVDGVTFRMPAKTAVDSTKYQTVFDWELKPELKSF